MAYSQSSTARLQTTSQLTQRDVVPVSLAITLAPSISRTAQFLAIAVLQWDPMEAVCSKGQVVTSILSTAPSITTVRMITVKECKLLQGQQTLSTRPLPTTLQTTEVEAFR